MAENKSFFDDLDGNHKPESFEEEVFVKRKRSLTPLIVSTIIAVGVVVAALIIGKQGMVEVPDMAGWAVGDAKVWASNNNLQLVEQRTYSDDVTSEGIISQGIEPTTAVRKNSTVTVSVSAGLDPEVLIPFPTLKTMTRQEIDEWARVNGLAGIKFKAETSESFAKDSVISYRLLDGTEENFMRKHRIEITVSDGAKIISETLTMPDFYAKSKEEVVKWATEQQIMVNFETTFNEVVGYEQVLEQSVAKDSKFNRTEPVTITLSLGKAITVPDFVGMSSTEADSLATLQKVTLLKLTVASTEDEGTVLSQDVEAGSDIDEKSYITLYVAKKSDKVEVPNLVGLTAEQASEVASLYKVTLLKEYTNSTEKDNKVLSQDISAGSEISQDTYVTITIAKKQVTAPDFVGMTIEEATEIAGLHKITLLKQYKDSTDADGTVLDQDKTAGAIIEDDEYITLTVAKEHVLTPDFVGLTKEEAELLSKKKQLTLVFQEIATLDHDNKTVLSQSEKVGEMIAKDSSIVVEIASNSGVTIGDIEGMSKGEATAYMAERNVNITIIDAYNDQYEKGIVFDPSYKNQLLPADVTVVAYASLGKVKVGNFLDKNLTEILQWKDDVNSQGADIKIAINYDRDHNKDEGTIIKQSIISDDLDVDGSLSVTVSYKNIQIMVPNFKDWTEEVFVDWCHSNNIPYEIYYKFSNEDKGTIIRQSHISTPMPKGEALIINVSKGKIYIGDFTGLNREDVERFMDEIKVYGGSVKWQIREVETTEVADGTVIYQSRINVNLDQGEVVTIDISVFKEAE